MRTQNLKSVLDISNNENLSAFNKIPKQREKETVEDLICNIKNKLKYPILLSQILSGFMIGYEIPQLGDEFDLLRQSESLILNIELKSEEKDDAVIQQMRRKFYFLRLIKSECVTVKIFTYIKGGQLYEYNQANNTKDPAHIEDLIDLLHEQPPSEFSNFDELFLPKNYLVSPFNKPERFLEQDYFLNNQQSEIKREILQTVDKESTRLKIFCLEAGAGKGKSLLAYDIALSMAKHGKKISILHCAQLSKGHVELNNNFHEKYNITPIIGLYPGASNELKGMASSGVDFLLIDEAQRLESPHPLEVVSLFKDTTATILFCYDPKQKLLGRSGDSNQLLRRELPDIKIHDMLKQCNSTEGLDLRICKLKDKIRSNPIIAAFLRRIFSKNVFAPSDIVFSKNISVEYFDKHEMVSNYIADLCTFYDYTFINYTASRFGHGKGNPNSIAQTAKISVLFPDGNTSSNAHKIIGQEFDKVVLIMDDNFQFNNNQLWVRNNYYDLQSMLFQILSRAITSIKIIVVGNPDLYANLQKIIQNSLPEKPEIEETELEAKVSQ